ncbi:MAG: EamA family transporter [Clostridiales bacterium]|nr:EamA family transporter [Clostridiales bacterium]
MKDFVNLTILFSFTKALVLYYYYQGLPGTIIWCAVFRISGRISIFLKGTFFMTWILLTLVYGLLKGGREIAKKKSMNKNTVMEVLLIYTLIGFLMVVPRAPHAMGLPLEYYGLIAIKSFVIFLAWILSFRALKHLPVSLYGILDLSRVLLATLLGVFVLHEVLVWNQVLGLALVAFGLLALKFRIFGKKKPDSASENKTEENHAEASDISSGKAPDKASSKAPAEGSGNLTKFVLMAFGSCLLNAVSGLMDKILMKSISGAQLQFWYMLFLLLFYLAYVVITKTRISSTVWKNGWIWILALMFVIGDAALFAANGISGSRVTVMTLIKQSGCFVTIAGGKFFFHEKDIGYRVFCASIIFCGILLSVLPLA